MKQAPTPMQQRVLERLHSVTSDQSLSDLARSMGITYVTLKQHLEALHRKGHLEFRSIGRGKSPTVRLPSSQTLEEAVAELERRGWWISGPYPTATGSGRWLIQRIAVGGQVVVGLGATWREAYNEAMSS